MSCAFTIGDSGTIIRADAAEDISDNTELSLVFTKPNGDQVTKTQTDGKVKLGSIDVFDKSLNETLLANQYVEYSLEADLLDIEGNQWSRHLVFDKDDVTPPIHIVGRRNGFTVIEA